MAKADFTAYGKAVRRLGRVACVAILALGCGSQGVDADRGSLRIALSSYSFHLPRDAQDVVRRRHLFAFRVQDRGSWYRAVAYDIPIGEGYSDSEIVREYLARFSEKVSGLHNLHSKARWLPFQSVTHLSMSYEFEDKGRFVPFKADVFIGETVIEVYRIPLYGEALESPRLRAWLSTMRQDQR